MRAPILGQPRGGVTDDVFVTAEVANAGEAQAPGLLKISALRRDLRADVAADRHEPGGVPG